MAVCVIMEGGRAHLQLDLMHNELQSPMHCGIAFSEHPFTSSAYIYIRHIYQT